MDQASFFQFLFKPLDCFFVLMLVIVYLSFLHLESGFAGVYIDADGNRYIGEWKEGKRDGRGNTSRKRIQSLYLLIRLLTGLDDSLIYI